jgi:hypothetical protein
MDSPNLRRLFAAAVPHGSDEEDDPYGFGRLPFAVTYEVARRADDEQSYLAAVSPLFLLSNAQSASVISL